MKLKVSQNDSPFTHSISRELRTSQDRLARSSGSIASITASAPLHPPQRRPSASPRPPHPRSASSLGSKLDLNRPAASGRRDWTKRALIPRPHRRYEAKLEGILRQAKQAPPRSSKERRTAGLLPRVGAAPISSPGRSRAPRPRTSAAYPVSTTSSCRTASINVNDSSTPCLLWQGGVHRAGTELTLWSVFGKPETSATGTPRNACAGKAFYLPNHTS